MMFEKQETFRISDGCQARFSGLFGDGCRDGQET